MGRRVAIVGAVLAALGVALQIWWLPGSPRITSSGPLNTLVNDVLQFLPSLGALCSLAGGLMLALAILIGVTGHLPLPGATPALLWIGLALAVLAGAIEFFWQSRMYETAQAVPWRVLSVVLAGNFLLRVIGAGLIALWLTGLTTGQRQRLPRDRGEPALAPSRPF